MAADGNGTAATAALPEHLSGSPARSSSSAAAGGVRKPHGEVLRRLDSWTGEIVDTYYDTAAAAALSSCESISEHLFPLYEATEGWPAGAPAKAAAPPPPPSLAPVRHHDTPLAVPLAVPLAPSDVERHVDEALIAAATRALAACKVQLHQNGLGPLSSAASSA